jgi:hypothetical protein
LSAKLVPSFGDRGCHVVSVTDPYGRILGFLGRVRVFKIAPPLHLLFNGRKGLSTICHSHSAVCDSSGHSLALSLSLSLSHTHTHTHTQLTPPRNHRFQQFLYCYVFTHCSGEIFTESLINSARLFRLHYSVFQAPFICRRSKKR